MEIDTYTICCSKCGTVFVIPKALDVRYRESHQSFYCPNGHSLSYPQSTTEDLLRKDNQQRIQTILKLQAENRKLKAAMKKEDAKKGDGKK